MEPNVATDSAMATAPHVNADIAAALEPRAQLVPARRQDEDEDRLRPHSLDGGRPLRVHVEQDVLAAAERPVDLRHGGPVPSRVDFRPLEELPTRQHLVEPRGIDEIIVHALGLSGPRRPRA